MARFSILINGHNILLATEKGEERCGFYQTHWIEAVDTCSAVEIAVEKIRRSQWLREAALNEADDPPIFEVEEIKEVDTFDGVEANPTGRAFYPEYGRALSLDGRDPD